MKETKRIIIWNVICSIIGGINVCFFLFLYTIMFDGKTLLDIVPLFLISATLTTLNLFKIKKTYINNLWYLISFLIFQIYIMIHSILSIYNYFTILNNEQLFEVHNYFWKPMIYIFMILILFGIISLLVKKIEIHGSKHDTLFLIGILLSCADMIYILELIRAILLSCLFFCTCSLLLKNDFRTSSLNKKYFLFTLLSLLCINPLGVIIGICNISQVEKIGFKE